jgi:peptide/nickel transport system substrate-binding protein
MAALLAVAFLGWCAISPRTPGEEPTPTRGGRLVAAVRVEPRSFNRLVVRDAASDVLATLTQGRLVRVNRETLEVEPWLAERWESSDDGRTHTLHLRKGVEWSDGTPFTSADVLFTLEAVFDARSASPLAGSLTVGRQPIQAMAPDAHTVVVTYAGPSGHGIRLLDNLTIYPKHKLQNALAAGTLATSWPMSTPASDLAGTGPFVLREYQAGQRVVLDRNPRYWRKADDGTALPYLDRIVLEVVPDQAAELLRLQSGEIDLIQDALRHEDYVAARRAESSGRIRMVELGVTTDADAFWFCLKPEAKKKDPRFEFVRRPEFRQALSHAVDREAFAQTVFLGEAVPVWGPVTPGNRAWFSPNVPRYPPDRDRARALLKSIGLEDRNGNGVVEDTRGVEARFTMIAQQGLGWNDRGTTVLKAEAEKIGIRLDVAMVAFGALVERLTTCNYDAIYMRPLATDLDPAGNLDFWLSSGSAHLWNMEQKMPATQWEARVDTLMLEQAASLDEIRRKELFSHVQRILGEQVPVLYFAAPRMHTAVSPRVLGVRPSVQRPPVLWNADRLGVQ